MRTCGGRILPLGVRPGRIVDRGLPFSSCLFSLRGVVLAGLYRLLLWPVGLARGAVGALICAHEMPTSRTRRARQRALGGGHGV